MQSFVKIIFFTTNYNLIHINLHSYQRQKVGRQTNDSLKTFRSAVRTDILHSIQLFTNDIENRHFITGCTSSFLLRAVFCFFIRRIDLACLLHCDVIFLRLQLQHFTSLPTGNVSTFAHQTANQTFLWHNILRKEIQIQKL